MAQPLEHRSRKTGRHPAAAAAAGASTVSVLMVLALGGLAGGRFGGSQGVEAFVTPFVGGVVKRLPFVGASTGRSRSILPVARKGVSMSAVQGKTIEMYMPALSSTMEEGTIVQWLKEVGDKIEVGDPVMVVESDKADMDVESFEEGYLAAVLTEEGSSAKVGAAVALIVESEGDIAAAQAAGPAVGGGDAAPAAEAADAPGAF